MNLRRFSAPDPRVSMAPNLNSKYSLLPRGLRRRFRLLPSVLHNFSILQFTNLRTLTLFTSPSIRNMDQMLDPP